MVRDGKILKNERGSWVIGEEDEMPGL